MFKAGQGRAEVARLCGVSWRSAHEWHRVWSHEGSGALKATTKPGPKAKFSDAEVTVIEEQLRRGPTEHGYENDLWTRRRVGRLVTET